MVEIDGEDELFRRILKYFYVPEAKRISSSAFMAKGKRLDPEVSVYLARLSDPEAVLKAGAPEQKLISFLAEVPFALGLGVRHDPTEQFEGHCVITGFGANWKEQCDRLAEASRLVETD
jgi:hypothetical protein